MRPDGDVTRRSRSRGRRDRNGRGEQGTIAPAALAAVVVAALVVAGLGSPLVGTVVADQDNVAIYDGAGGSTIGTAGPGQTVYVNANDSGNTTGGTVDVTVSNGSTGSITVTLYDDGTNADSTQTSGDGEYWGSFTVSATTTDDGTDELLVQEGSAATVQTVDLDGQNDGDTASVTADYGPVPQSATTQDGDGDGTVDGVQVTFDESVASASVDTSDFGVSGSVSVTGVADNDDDDTLLLNVDAPQDDTAITPDVTVTQGSLDDPNGNAGPASGDATVTASDGAQPRVASIESIDASSEDGTIDRVEVTYTEDVSTSAPELGDYSLGGGDAGSVTLDSANVNGGTLSLPVTAPADDTDLDLTLSYDRTAGSTDSVVDGAGNAAPSFTGRTVADGAGPVIASATTRDTNQDGEIDEIDLVFTEPVNDSTVTDTSFTVLVGSDSKSVTGIDNSEGTNDEKMTLLMDGFSTDTAVRPDITNVANVWEDLSSNTNPDQIATASDGASPVIVDAETADTNDDGTVDRIEANLSEPLSDGDSTLDGSTFSSVTGADIGTATSGTNTDDDTIVVGVSGTSTEDTSITLSDLVLSAGALSDGSNVNSQQTLATVSDGAGPAVLDVTTVDGDANGRVDALTVTASEAVASGSVEAADFSIDSANGLSGSLAGVSGDDGDDVVTVDLSEGSSADTDATPTLGYASDGGTDVQDGAGNLLADTTTDPATDGAAPVIASATTADANGDGDVDRIDVTLSESIDDGGSTVAASSFSLSEGNVDGVDTGTSDDDAVQLSVSGLSGTGVTPDVTLAANALADGGGNSIGTAQTFTGTTSGAAATVTDATVLDRDGDGNVDAATLTFSGAVDDSTFVTSEWSLGGSAVDAIDTGASADDDTLQLRITTDANEPSGTDPVEVTYTPGSATDLAGNSIAAIGDGDLDESDGATPVIEDVSAETASDDQSRITVTVTATERLDSVSVDLSGPASATLSSFSTSGSDPTDHTLTESVNTGGTYTVTLRTAADAAGNDGAADEETTVSVTLPSSGGGGGGGSSAPGASANRVGSAQVPVFSSARSASFDLSGGAIDRVDVSTSADATGFARATELASVPGGTATPEGRTMGVVELEMPGAWRTASATVSLRIEASDADPDRLRVARYDDAAGSWSILDTTADRRGDGTVSVTAETSHFSLFAVVEVEDTETDDDGTPTPADEVSDVVEDEPTERPDDRTPTAGDGEPTTAAPSDDGEGTATATTTAGDGAGFGPVVALTALVAVGALLRRRR